MTFTELHSQFLSEAFEEVLGKPESGTMAFVRFLTPDVVELLAEDANFSPSGWQVRRVWDEYDSETRSITGPIMPSRCIDERICVFQYNM